MSRKRGFLAPNTTQTPDALFALMPVMGEAELRVTLHLVRQTLGWRREWSDPEYSTVPAIARATGLSPEGVRRGIRAGIARGTVERADSATTRSFTYRLVLATTEDQPEQERPSEPFEGSTALRVNLLEGQPAGGSRVNEVGGMGQLAGGCIKKNTHIHPLNTHKDSRTVVVEVEGGVVPADAGTAAAPSASGVVEAAWAKRTTGLPRRKPARIPTEQQQFFEAVASACGMDPAFMAEADRANVGRLASRLQADPEIDLAFVADCAAAWGSQFPGRATADVRPPSVGQFTTWIGRRKAARLPQARPSAEF